MSTVQDYQNLITSEHDDKPDFLAHIAATVSPMVQVQAVLASMIPLFDLDTPPVGDQLDIIGQWVGATRNIDIPITGIFFTWDGTDAQGWSYGIWQSSSNDTAVTTLPDDVYLTLILATIAANSWDGTTEGAYAIFDILFPNITLLIQDYQDMSYDILVIGTLDSLSQALLVQGYLALKPEGVRINNYYIQAVPGPFFAWNVENANLSGWGTGSWGIDIPGS
jgi:hypothetical protein